MLGNKSQYAAHLRAVEESGRAERLFPHAQTQVIDGVGHMIHFEAPDVLAAAIDRFMRL